ncbi:helix-turn-helix domain-containing protein [Bacillus sp. SN10]|uniref:helix-turn-helix domain-containing protein n=1 Tax=Bacillus sp. SN10 TaxID=2056493 RepID=UPI0012FEEEDF|nr:helix-turn-helix domain-containing protein [Bacillus sp. SN10]
MYDTSLNIGHIIKELRQKRNMRQEELAYGICSQANISMIESGKIYPNTFILHQIACKLRVPLNYFFLTNDDSMDKYRNNTVRQIVQKFLRDKDYDQVLIFIKEEKEIGTFSKNNYDLQFLIWAETICLYYTNKLDDPIVSLKKALRKTFTTLNHITEQELLILNSIGIILSEKGKSKHAIRILKWINTTLNSNYYISDYTLLIKNTYAYAQTLSRQSLYHQAINLCDKAINYCLFIESSFLVGELYYEKGLNLYYLRNFHEAQCFFNYAVQIFEIKKQPQYRDFVLGKIEEFLLSPLSTVN